MELEEYKNIKEEVRTLNYVIFGNPHTGEKGMKQKLDEVHEILLQSKGVISFFGGVKGILGLAITVAAALTILKGWLR